MTSPARVWRAHVDAVEVCFVGRGGPVERDLAIRRAADRHLPVAWLEQRHSAVCVEAAGGCCGEGDALWTAEPELALCVATADCVPVALAGARGVAMIHAGWRGIVAGVVGRAARAVETRSPGARAWIGPAVGVCCYEVGGDVAAEVEAASGPGVVVAGNGQRPHLDLAAAVEYQLRGMGVASVERLGPCTRCSPDLLHSYRRDGAGAGRNLSYVWLRRAPARSRRSDGSVTLPARFTSPRSG